MMNSRDFHDWHWMALAAFQCFNFGWKWIDWTCIDRAWQGVIMISELIRAPIDFEAVPACYEGKWILVRVDPARGEQEIVSSGESARDATRGQPHGSQYLLTRVPHKYSVLVVSDPK